MEKRIRRLAQRHGYRIQRDRGSCTLINERLNAVMWHFQGVSLEEIAAFFDDQT